MNASSVQLGTSAATTIELVTVNVVEVFFYGGVLVGETVSTGDKNTTAEFIAGKSGVTL